MSEFDTAATDLTSLSKWLEIRDKWDIEFETIFADTDTSSFLLSKFQHLDGQLAELQSDCTNTVQNHVLRLGQLNEHAMVEIKGLHLSDLAFISKFRIVDFGNDPESWLGVQFRGFKPATLGGYVIYLRANGSLELFDPEYRVTQLLQLHSETLHWVELLVVARKHTLEVYLASEGSRIINVHKRDLSFTSEGWISFQTYRTISEFEYFRVWNIPNAGSIN